MLRVELRLPSYLINPTKQILCWLKRFIRIIHVTWQSKKHSAIAKSIKAIAARDFGGDLDGAAQWLKTRVLQYANSPQGKREDRSLIPYPATWFNGARYDDDDSEWNHVCAAGQSNHNSVRLIASPTEGFEDILERQASVCSAEWEAQ